MHKIRPQRSARSNEQKHENYDILPFEGMSSYLNDLNLSIVEQFALFVQHCYPSP